MQPTRIRSKLRREFEKLYEIVNKTHAGALSHSGAFSALSRALSLSTVLSGLPLNPSSLTIHQPNAQFKPFQTELRSHTERSEAQKDLSVWSRCL
ncbi:hypothetical protein VNO78_03002 [Psophocarpus tetragonolobus]|uniref:Uncharacterized protein n=1 Tax=Psophocarpus tetragonolobus TaxID=3891 RepID=A0AAN9SZN4_PSOTE